jgi:hypothetical protein
MMIQAMRLNIRKMQQVTPMGFAAYAELFLQTGHPRMGF